MAIAGFPAIAPYHLTGSFKPGRPVAFGHKATLGGTGALADDTAPVDTYGEAPKYERHKIYSPSGTLSPTQKVCTFMIEEVYHRITRYNTLPGVGGVFRGVSSGCPFKKRGKLSCSEYTLVQIHEKGTAIGILKGLGRLLRCNPLTKNFED